MDKKKKKLDIRVLFTRCLLCGAILYVLVLFVSQQFDLARLSDEGAALDTQIEQAEKENEELNRQKEASDSPEFVERVARDKLGYMKPDEKVFVDAKKQ